MANEERTKFFKNLTLAVQKLSVDDIKCQCATHFNMGSQIEHLNTCTNSPTTVKSADTDCCTYGTHYPNRIFAGHLPGKVNATELADFFRSYGNVLEGKVVLDSFGRSRRFGFVTFATQDDVQNVLSQGEMFFKGKKINVGPAVKKMFGAEFSPPETSDYATAYSDGSMSPVSASSNDPDASAEKIVTVPPINEKKVTEGGGHTGNVWLKITSKPKCMSPFKSSVQTKRCELNLPTFPQGLMYQFQPITYQPYVYQPVYTLPCQGFNFNETYFIQQPSYTSEFIPQLMPIPQMGM